MFKLIGDRPRIGSGGDEVIGEYTSANAVRFYRTACEREATLFQSDRNALTTDFLVALALMDRLTLSEVDKGRLSALHLARLAASDKITLTDADRARFTSDQLFQLFVDGIIAISDAEYAQFSRQQQEQIAALETESTAAFEPHAAATP